MSDSIRDNLFYALKYRSSSYKCFLLLFLLKRVSNDRRSFSFDELSKGIVVEAWNYLPAFNGPLTKVDDIFDLCLDLIDKSNNMLTAFSSEGQVNRFLEMIDDVRLVKRIHNLCLYAPYRLDTNNTISEFLHGIPDRKKNKIIKELSHHYDLFYVINEKEIVINLEYVNYIVRNRFSLIEDTKTFIEERYANI